MARNDAPETIVAAGMRIEGELKSNGNIRVDGNVTGKVHTSQDLTIGQTAQVEAEIVAASAVIAGVVRGNVSVKSQVVITETGRLLGNVSCGSISIRPGAFFTGQCRMNEPKRSENGEVKAQTH